MIPATPDALSQVQGEIVDEVREWRPAHGVLSLYVHADPGDRSEGWRIAIRNQVAACVEAAEKEGDRELTMAVRATAERVLAELDARKELEPSGLIGFVEVSRDEGAERWYASRQPPRRTEVVHGPIAHLHPLLELLDDGAAMGVALISSERVRLLHWQLGSIEELHSWELSIFADDWRERKAERPDPARGSATSASGRDQHDQRLEANRERFVQEAGGLAIAEAKQRGWRELLVFGPQALARKLEEGFGQADPVRLVDQADLISEPVAEVEERIARAVDSINRERELGLIERLKESAYVGGRSALGPQETIQSLAEGRVEHLVYDAERDYSSVDLTLDGLERPAGMPLADWMIELALSTSAAVTPVEGESAEALREQDGVAALLRY